MKRVEKLQKKNSNVHERTKQDKEPRVYKGLVPFFLAILCGGLIYLLFFSGSFTVRNIEVVGYSNPNLVKGIVEEALQKSYLNNNILIFQKGATEAIIKEDSGVISVSIKKKYPNTLVVQVQESTPTIIWETKGESFLIDDRGYVIGKNKNNDLPLVSDSLNIKVGLGERVASPTFIKFINDLSGNYPRVVGEEIEKIIIFDILSDVRIKSESGFLVYLDASREPVSQLENLVRVLAEAEEEGDNNLEYIDMRLSDRVFYK